MNSGRVGVFCWSCRPVSHYDFLKLNLFNEGSLWIKSESINRQNQYAILTIHNEAAMLLQVQLPLPLHSNGGWRPWTKPQPFAPVARCQLPLSKRVCFTPPRRFCIRIQIRYSLIQTPPLSQASPYYWLSDWMAEFPQHLFAVLYTYITYSDYSLPQPCHIFLPIHPSPSFLVFFQDSWRCYLSFLLKECKASRWRRTSRTAQFRIWWIHLQWSVSRPWIKSVLCSASACLSSIHT